MAVGPDLLVLRALGLGDLLASVPALRGCRRAWPQHRLVLAAPRLLAEWAQRLGLVDATVDAAPLEPLRWDGPPPDVAVNLHGRGPQSHQLLQALTPGRLLAFDQPGAGHVGPPWRGPGAAVEHEVGRWNRLLDASTGGRSACSVDDLLLPSPTTPSPRAGAVVVHPGAASRSRRWPAGRFAAVAAHLSSTGREVVVTGGAAETAVTEEVVRAAGLDPSADLGGRLDLDELHALVDGASLVVVGDTGVGHLATASRTPSVHLFGPVSPDAWGPVIDADRHRVLWHGEPHEDADGDPHGDEVDARLDRIRVDEVVRACRTLLTDAGVSPAR